MQSLSMIKNSLRLTISRG